jgi:hypothetical protein
METAALPNVGGNPAIARSGPETQTETETELTIHARHADPQRARRYRHLTGE